MSSAVGSNSPYLVLAEYLRQHPECIRQSPETIAQATGLETNLIREVLSTAKRRAEAPEKRRSMRDLLGVRQASQRLGKVVRWIGDHPIASIIISTIFALTLTIAVAALAPTTFTFRAGLQTDNVLVGVVWLVVCGFHSFLYLVKGMVRYAWYGATAFFVVSTVVTATALLIARQGNWTGVIGASVAFFILSFLYGIGGSIFSVIGGFIRIRLEEQARSRLSRQELLDRLLDVQERLRSAEEGKSSVRTWRDHPIFVRYQKSPFLFSGTLSFVITLMSVLVTGPIPKPLERDPTSAIAIGILTMIFSVSALAAQAVVAFLAGRTGRGILIAVWFNVIGVIPNLIPIGQYGPKFVLDKFPEEILVSIGFSVLVGLLAGLGSQIEYRAARQRQLESDDPSALVAELAQLQMLLNPREGSLTVMVVDAAQSSKMKAEADPYVAEWSFREYQSLLSRVSAEFQGRVHSTAGDGAVIAFDDPNSAFHASVRMQQEIQLYNERLNRLPSPFRLRIGLHAGTVMGALDEVEFTEVIDIAAHIEGKCEIGGIAASRIVAEAIGLEKFTDSGVEVDNQRVWLAKPENFTA